MFKNESPLDFSIDSVREAMRQALAELDREIASGKLRAAPIIEGREIKTTSELKSLNPANPTSVVGTVGMCTAADAARALESLSKYASDWEFTSYTTRAEIIRAAGAGMRAKRLRLTALVIREAGKPWREADADVVEAIDFCDYYAEEMLRLGAPRLTQVVAGEENHYFYQPRGVAAIISPWNFPLAIATGMATAALVTGNATALKPAGQTCLIAYELAKILLAAGVPGNAFSFLPGPGSAVGAELVNSTRTDMICFTGSKEVGLGIISRAGSVVDGQRNIKRAIAELGGKNAIIVDDDADLDEAIKGVIYSAFGYAGQKCSACSRVIVVGDAYTPFITRLCDAMADIIVGDPAEPGTFLGPVIDQASQARILETIEAAKRECTLAFSGSVPKSGYFVPATIFKDVKPTAQIWREEIFGPVLACCAARDFEHAIELANDCEYALTGGVFSRRPTHIERAKQRFKVGNLYINRSCTGAVVCRHPFGGFRMSGVGSKAGGPDYLIQFMEPRTVSENTMRRGFAPE